MNDDPDRAEMRRTVTSDRNRTYAKLGPDGDLTLVARGKGLTIKLSPLELRRFAHTALDIAADLESRADAVGEAVLEQLATITRGHA